MTGLYLNTNVSSVQSQNYLRRNMSELSNVLTRLSTGLRINSGKDDPAGMIASELIRSDITGANMAVRNTQRANSVIAIAESALGQVSAMLNDIRGLVNEAANSAAMSSDMVAANQLQIDATLDSIDRIARTTNFMGKKILDGSLDFVTANQTSGQLDTLRIDSANFGNAPSIGVNIDVIKTAATAKLYFNQGGISQQTVLEIGGNYGSEVFNFQAGASIEDIARGVNLVTDATGVRAVLGKDATQGQLLTTSAGGGVHNDINIRAIDAGFASGNYSVKFSAGTSTKSNYVITPPAYDRPGVIDIQLQMEESRGASAHAINEYFNIKANQPGTMFNNTDVIFLEDNAAQTTLSNGSVVNAEVSFEKGPRVAKGTIKETWDNAGTPATTGLNTLHISAASAGTSFNNVDIQYVVDGTLATAAGASYDANAKLLTIAVRDSNTTYADIAQALKNNTDFRLDEVKTTGGGVNVSFDTRINADPLTNGVVTTQFPKAIGATGATMGTDSNAIVVRYRDQAANQTSLQDIVDAINDYTDASDPLGQTGSLFTAELAHPSDAGFAINTKVGVATLATAAVSTFTFDYTKITTASGKQINQLLDGMKIVLVNGGGDRYNSSTNVAMIDTAGAGLAIATAATRLETLLNGQVVGGEVLSVQTTAIAGGGGAIVAADVGVSAILKSGSATRFLSNSTFAKVLQDGNCGYVSKLTANEVIDFINSSEELSRLISAENAFGSTGLAKVTLFDEVAYYGEPNAGNALQFLGPNGAPSIIFSANAPNQALSLGFIPAEVSQPTANLVSTNANAAITLTSFQQGSRYDDVVVRFKAAEPGTGNSVTFADCPSSAMAYVSLDPNNAFGTNLQFIVTAKTPGVDYNMADIVFRLDVHQSAPAVAAYDKESNKLIVTVNSNSGNSASNPRAVTTNDIIAAINRTPEFSAELDHTSAVNNGSGFANLIFPETNATATFAGAGAAKITFSANIVDTAGDPAISLFKDMTVVSGAATGYANGTLTVLIGATAADIAGALNGAVINGKTLPNTATLTPLITITGVIPAAGAATGVIMGATKTEATVGNTGSTGGHKGVVEIRLETNVDGDSVLTSGEIVAMINADTVVNRIFSAKNYIGSDGTGLIDIHGDTIRNVTGGSGISYPASVMTTSGGVKGEDLMEIRLATDKYGTAITTARDLVEFMNTLDAEVTRGISVSLVRPQGVDNLLRSWITDACGNVTEIQACIDDAGWGLLKPTSYTDECNNLYLTPIMFSSQGENPTPTRPWAEIVAVNGIDASFRLFASIPGAEYEGVTMQYFITQGGSDNPPRAEYDPATKKLTVFVIEGTTASGVANLVHTSEQTKNLFKIEQLGTGSGIIHEADDAVTLKNGMYNAGYRGGARLLWNADADAHKLIFESINKGADQRVDVRVINGVPFDVYNEAGIKTTRDFGEDMTARLNGLTMVSRGNMVSINTAMLSMTMNVSDNVLAGDTISFDIVSGGATFQIGPDVVSMQQLRLGIQSVSTARLGGASGLLMQLRNGENASLTNNSKLADLIVQDAINSVAVLRGRLGTTQRCTLDPNMSVLQDTLVEMSAAEAQISNADFAEESSRLTRAQILVQSGARTLQIANQLPQYAAMLMGG